MHPWQVPAFATATATPWRRVENHVVALNQDRVDLLSDLVALAALLIDAT